MEIPEFKRKEFDSVEKLSVIHVCVYMVFLCVIMVKNCDTIVNPIFYFKCVYRKTQYIVLYILWTNRPGY
jgi:hypothetical protein